MALTMATASNLVEEVDSFALAEDWEDVPSRQLQEEEEFEEEEG